MPGPRGAVESLTVSGRAAPAGRPILLTRAATPRIDGAIERTASAPVEDHVCDLREIDLDNYSMVIRNAADVREVRCPFDESLLEAAKAALDRRVKVTGAREPGSGRRASATLHVLRLELLDVPATEAGPESAADAAVADSACERRGPWPCQAAGQLRVIERATCGSDWPPPPSWQQPLCPFTLIPGTQRWFG